MAESRLLEPCTKRRARSRLGLRCTSCGHPVAVAVATEGMPSLPQPRGIGALEEPSASLATLARKVIGSDSVRRWRFEQLQQAGYPAGDAFVLSGRSDVDLHQAIRLLRDRCKAATAVRIRHPNARLLTAIAALAGYSAGRLGRNRVPHSPLWALRGAVSERHAPRRRMHLSNASDLSSGGARALVRRLALNVACPECGAPEGELCERSLLAPSTQGRSHASDGEPPMAGNDTEVGLLPNDA